MTRRYGGLILEVDGWEFNKNVIPVGWVARPVPSRDAYRVAPRWIDLLVQLVGLRYFVLRTFMRLGFLQGVEGCEFSAADWTLRVWESRPYARLAELPKRSAYFWLPYHLWYRFWLWLANDWKERMPRWV